MKFLRHLCILAFQILSFLFLLHAFARPAQAGAFSLLTGGLGLVGNLLGGLLGSSAASKAAKIQEQNAQQVAGMAESATQGAQAGMGQAVGIANQNLSATGQTNQNLYNPYLTLGQMGTASLASAVQPGGALGGSFSFDPSQVANTPQYQFALQQGTQAVQQQAAAQGLLNSGSTLKNLMSFGQGLASQQEQQAYNQALGTYQTNYGNTLQSLGMLTNVGQNATNALSGQNLSLAQLMSGNTLGAAQYGGNVGLQGAQIAGQALTAGANAQAAGIMGQANAWSNALSGIGNTISGIGSYSLPNSYISNPNSFAMPAWNPAAYASYGASPFPTAPAGVIGAGAPNLSGYSLSGIGLG